MAHSQLHSSRFEPRRAFERLGMHLAVRRNEMPVDMSNPRYARKTWHRGVGQRGGWTAEGRAFFLGLAALWRHLSSHLTRLMCIADPRPTRSHGADRKQKAAGHSSGCRGDRQHTGGSDCAPC